jgi:hypothetical protein
MPAPYHLISSKLDRALAAYLISIGAGTAEDTYPAKRAFDKIAPCTICWTERAKLNLNTGIYACDVSIICKYSTATAPDGDPEQTRQNSDVRTGTVFDAFFTILDAAPTDDESLVWDSKKIAKQITAAARALAAAHPDQFGDLADFTVLDVRHGEQEGAFEEDTDTWTDSFSLQIDAVNSNVS